MKYLMRLIILMVACVVLLIASDVGADLDTPIDESVPELVKGYLTFPCGFLDISYHFQKIEIEHAKNRKIKCIAWAKKYDVKYGNAVCAYVEMERLFMYEHLKSVERALELMCNEDGTQKNPRIEIKF